MLGRDILETAMRRAFELAALGPADNPNPQVGCVILDPAGVIVSEGWHRGAGTPHAEVAALAALPTQWRDRSGELTAVASLEPCNHTGRTGPCAVALVDAGIGAVAFSMSDPGNASSGGSATLRAAGVEVLGGVLEAEGNKILESWVERKAAQTELEQQAAPKLQNSVGVHVTVKWAQTLDGRAAAADGSSQWITGKAARRDVHQRRAAADAILVGTGTLFADNPALTARDESHETGLLVPAEAQPIPVVLGKREIPANALIREHPALAANGLDAPLHFAGDNLADHLAELRSRGVRSVFVEGGPTIATAFLRAGLVDEVLVYVAPALLGGPRVAISDLGIESMADIQRLSITDVTRLDEDLLIKASIHHTENEEGH
ncbi:bifunctional diaminohydroxyphosphoribosylaminopyrimidine deaminase/5-amino-6-(5-phosphoribosylamino)uracil reductase RibD [Leucobacter sp. UT-8R-CII-1-4]|uniref:bifunctional diaminohydroxyphosphoribosylaminopyrimidine deaminase/5-amino-6-(5-phosphoribosylamino)uracil reductase RibD n=1 Tax=Leucobacter sp. UT-8R-CII-1-4 TaxID=3040075 RepID=UPI0024A874F0|nr:bifunctional diaminohydroxyphosphoribosylaminopyrimidine deaminase/5-amino-6-(5-phosphoribosylamino)uracil reductase RibD [Leucobacter sp. UT-8R-CII-1-4]MDI6023595.1 bifunctional diaminohydroxyphosphoribosylaminopyrimidine deaminase/5-amino-6-(5-phosphoribosylamino)uracil reductase RibD [Leucobacter sp. UT-8R-CII-1-4]